MNLSCTALSEKTEPLTGMITFIRRNYPQPTSVHKIDLSTRRTLELLRGTDERPYIRFFRYSPDNHHFVVTMGSIENEQADTELYIGNDNNAQLERLTENSIFEGYPAWSTDGKRIVFVRGIRSASNRFWVIDLESKQEQQVPEPDIRIHRWADWLPDGQRLVVVAKANVNGSESKEVSGLAEIHLGKGTARWLYKGDVYILTPRFSKDRKRLTCIVQSRQPYYNKRNEPEHINRVHMLDLNTERIQTIDEGPGVFERDLWPVWSPDGKQLAWIRSNGKNRISKLLIHNLETGKSQEIALSEEAADGYSLLWSPDGKHLACVTHHQRQHYTVRVVTLKSGKSRTVLTSKSQIQCLYWR